MASPQGICTARGLVRLLACVLSAGALLASTPPSAGAALTTFGSELSVPATLNTAENLSYYGTYTPVPPNPEAPNGLYHTYHYGADMAVWNVVLANGQAASPATGQAVKVSLEGCAQPAAGGPPPLTQMHFQVLTPLRGGGVQVSLTSQAFDIPICGQNGANGATVSTYEPLNLCVAKGDYVAFNNEGGWVPHVYQSGVPYSVIGSVGGSTMDTFIRPNGTNDGDTFLPSETSANEGFAVNDSEELELQVTLGTGPDATYICPGGRAGKPAELPALHIRPQTDGINRSRMISVAVYCRPSDGCNGPATLSFGGAHPAQVHAGYSLPGARTGHLKVQVPASVASSLRHARGGISGTLTLLYEGRSFSQEILVKIL